jgi:hypothetical protein
LDDNNLNTQYFEESQRSMSTKQIFWSEKPYTQP